MNRLLPGLLIALACSENRAPAVTAVALPPGVVARVANEDIRTETVVRIAKAQRIEPSLARDRAVEDALFAAAARSDPERRAVLAVAERTILGRLMLEEIRTRALARGPATDEEIATLTAERWVELDRPVSVRTAHAVVRVEKPADDTPARTLAERLRDAVKGVSDLNEFLNRAKALPTGGLTIRAEYLPPVTPDGRIWDPESRPPAAVQGSFDADFTRAAHAIANVGEQSGIVKTSFGYHVILLVARVPEERMSLEARREALASTVLSRRAKPELDALLARLRSETKIEVERSAEELTALVPIAP